MREQAAVFAVSCTRTRRRRQRRPRVAEDAAQHLALRVHVCVAVDLEQRGSQRAGPHRGAARGLGPVHHRVLHRLRPRREGLHNIFGVMA